MKTREVYGSTDENATMIALIQRVSSAQVQVDGATVGSAGRGILTATSACGLAGGGTQNAGKLVRRRQGDRVSRRRRDRLVPHSTLTSRVRRPRFVNQT